MNVENRRNYAPGKSKGTGEKGSFCQGFDEEDCNKAKTACQWIDGVSSYCRRRINTKYQSMTELNKLNSASNKVLNKKKRRVTMANSAIQHKEIGIECEEGLGRLVKPQTKDGPVFAALYLRDYATKNAYGCNGYMMYDFNSGQYCCSSRVRTPEEMIQYLFFMADSVSNAEPTKLDNDLYRDTEIPLSRRNFEARQRKKRMAEKEDYIGFIDYYFNEFIVQVQDQKIKARLQIIYQEKKREMNGQI